VGVAVASERKGIGGSPEGRWWLGLPVDKFQSAVLICADHTGKIWAVNLPKRFVDEHRDQFGRAASGQHQFNVAKINERFYLQIPKTGRIDVSQYVEHPLVGNYSEDYALQEYGMTKAEMKAAARRIEKDIAAERRRGTVKPFTGNSNAEF